MTGLKKIEQILSVDREGNEVIITGENKYILLEEFLNRFGDDYRFDSIYNHENTTPAWRKLFEEWKHRGILE